MAYGFANLNKLYSTFIFYKVSEEWCYPMLITGYPLRVQVIFSGKFIPMNT
jgi:hypothetical protein